MLMFVTDGTSPDKETDVSTTAYKGVDVFAELKTLITGQGTFLERATALLSGKVGFEQVLNATRQLDTESSNLIKALGVSSKRGAELTSLIAESIPEIVGMGLEAGDVYKTYSDVIESFDTNIMLSKDTVTELASTTKVTGVATKDLALNFRDVGLSIDSVGETMLDVAKIANQAGVTVASVSAGVVKNMDKLNLYNFEGGVKGLAKMAAQASRLGIDMGKIFDKTEELFSPEKAIDFAASLQRLGVTSSELLDPLRVMDLAQNDPTELQNQMVEMTKDFVRFNEQNKQFEILPGAKRRMREVAEAMGMSASEFSKMAINAASFDSKLKQIKFSPDIKDEDREMIATMAHINESGEAMVKVAVTDEKGELTGEFIEKAVKQLNPEDIKSLKTQQELQGKTMEELAFDQLSEQKKLNASIDKFITTLNYGLGSSKLTQETYKIATRGMTKGVESITPDFSTVKNSPDYVIDLLKSSGLDFTDVRTSLLSWTDEIIKSDVVKYIMDTFDDVKEYFIGGNTTTNATTSNLATTTLNSPITNYTPNENTTTASTNTQPTDINITHTFNFSNIPGYTTSEQVLSLLKQYVSEPQNALAIVAQSNKINGGLTS